MIVPKWTTMARCLLCLWSAIVVWAICSDACAQTRKREALPGIAKRGKLLFEDDFSEKDLLWTFDPSAGEWAIAKKTLVTKSIRGPGKGIQWSGVERKFTPTENVMVELRAFLPVGAGVTLSVSFPGSGGAAPQPDSAPAMVGEIRGCIAPDDKAMYIQFWNSETGGDRLVVEGFPYTRTRWIHVVFEVLDGHFALTADGRTLSWRQLPIARIKRSKVQLLLWTAKPFSNVVAIDDVKVWEALPKEEDGEAKKKK
jgi:hypothetical protein